MTRFRTISSASALTLVLVGTWACGESSPDGGGTGGLGGAGTGGGTTGGNGNTGGGTTGGNGNTGGNGTGGTSVGDHVPGTENYDCSAPTGTPPALQFETVAGGFDFPVLVTHAPGDTERLFVVEKSGIIKVITDIELGTVASAEFLNITDRIANPDEMGLLGLAFHPDYDENGLFYVHFSAAESLDDSEYSDSIIEEYQVSDSDPNVADESTMRRVFRLDQTTETNHAGGSLVFGPDRMLYLALGDGGGDRNLAQDESVLFGKILRLDPAPSGDDPYSIPEGNLAGAAPEVWDMGLRNPYRVNFDGCTGDFYIGDVGDGDWEEIDIKPRGDENKNYGWPIMEGLVCAQDGCDQTGLTLPVAVFDNTSGAAIVGGVVYRGSDIPSLRGTYFYADYIGDRVYSLTFDGTDTTEPVSWTDDLIGNPDQIAISSIQNGGDGEIYVTNASTGQVMKLAIE